MLSTNYITLEDFKIVDIATHCDYTKLNIAISDALNFDLPELLCEYYDLYINEIESEKTDLINGTTYKCGKITKKFLGLKAMLVYYSYANYLLNSTMTDTGIGFVKKTDQYSIPTPLKEVDAFVEANRNKGFAVIKQLKDYVSHDQELINKYDLPITKHCGCGYGKCDFTEKRVYTFRPKVIRKKL